jgi:RHH-type transcriptional regulator, proline utilization regulon repressor / proline dehydrogenase / delta 1-pyrroline-5-carboxylate dehydrogenase
VLCLQDDIADRTLTMLKAAMRELQVGPPDRLSCDVGPVISAEALAGLERHVGEMRAKGCAVHAEPLSAQCGHGYFLAPTLIEISSIGELTREVFGPVLHVLRRQRENLDALIEEINASGYALTGGAHSRIDAMIERVGSRLAAGNLYVNRNIIGAVVGVQPFGGRGLSGTGPKAGGPLYLKRLLARAPLDWPALPSGAPSNPAEELARALAYSGRRWFAELVRAVARNSRLGVETELKGPVGERNVYSLQARGAVLCDAELEDAMIAQLACVLAAGGRAIFQGEPAAFLLKSLPEAMRETIEIASPASRFEAALTDREGANLEAFLREMARREGPIVSVFRVDVDTLRRGEAPLDFLLGERSLCVNTTAAGGNASLMSIG